MKCGVMSGVATSKICQPITSATIVSGNKTRQGSVRKRFLKPAGYLFLEGAQ